MNHISYMSRSDETESARWTFLSNYGHVLLCIAATPDARVRDISDQVGITQRAVLRILKELEDAGVIERHKVGRRNEYVLQADLPLRHPLESHRTVGDLVRFVHRKRPKAKTG